MMSPPVNCVLQLAFLACKKEAKKVDEGELASSGKRVEDEVSLDNSDEIYITNMQ